MAQVVLMPGWQVFDENGNPAAGAKARFFLAGTSTPVNVFSDSALTTPHAVPVVADSEGRFPTIYAAAGDYKIKVTDSADVDLWPEVDNWTVLANLTQTIVSFPTVTKTTNYTVVAGDRGKVIEVDPAGATLVVTLEAATLGAGFPIWIVNTGATGTVQLQFSGAETLLDLTTYSLTDKHQAVGLTSRGASGWRLIAAVTLERMATIASAGTITLGDGGYFNVTGTTTITDIDFTNDIAGHKAWVKFADVLQLTHNATTLILPSGVNVPTAAGDTALFVSEGSDAVRCLVYNRANGAPLFGGITDVQTFTSSGTWTKPAGGTVARVRTWGGGGSGGHGQEAQAGGGGGGGACVEKWFLLSGLGATETVTIGNGGVAQATNATAGNVGGNTTFGASGTLVTAYGGGGGSGANFGGGGGGGGLTGVGATATTDVGGKNGDGGASNTGVGVGPTGGGGLGIAAGAAVNGSAGVGPSGGGGGGSTSGAGQTSGNGGMAENGGGGGGGGNEAAPGGGTGGVSINGGNGGAGTFDSTVGVTGSVPGGGGGGSELGNSGAGGKGMVQVFVFL